MAVQIKLIRKQSGVTLLLGLMFLLILTILGLSSSNVAIMQEQMAGNVSDANIAFQRAEGTLREVEDRLTSYITGGSGGLGHVPPTWEETGLAANDCAMSGVDDWDTLIGNLSWHDAPDTEGEYVVVDLSDYTSGGTIFGSSCRPISEAEMNTAGEYFLIVARATSPTGTSESIVQSIFYWPQ